ncbi:MAG TPA: ATP-binding cassette domain-containing protein, partial [Solirubrobacterales bacterium]|nr:ATP-binding cassette domain-containing protein [Solirubrobacterales bacterium]
GAATVFPEVLVAPTLSVADNVYLGQDRWTRFAVRGPERRARVAAVLEEISTQPFDPGAPVAELDLVRRHQVAIARALLSEPRLLILDESTAALDVSERDRLFEAVRRRVAAGVAVIFISHRLDEVLNLSDAVTVLSSGRKVATLGRGEITEARLLALLNPDREVTA